jgi:hypothetical protein
MQQGQHGAPCPSPTDTTRSAAVEDLDGSVTATQGGEETPAFRALALADGDAVSTGASL